MGKRIVSFLLMWVMLFTIVSTETFAMVPRDDGNVQEMHPMGGMQMPEAIEISQDEAEKIGIISEDDFNAGGELQLYSADYGSQRYGSSWDVYSSNYVYNRLEEKQRKFWDLLDAQSKTYLNGTKNANRISGMDGYYTTEGIDFSKLKMDWQQAGNVYLMFVYANPQYYFLDSGRYSHTTSVLIPIIYDAFAYGTARKAETEQMQLQINIMKAEIEKGATDLEKARIAHDIIIKKVDYDHAYDTGYPSTLYHQSAYSVFCDSYTVCAGYTKAFELLLNAVGIDTIGVTSSKTEIVNGKRVRSGHAWNAVCLNDSWYYVDCTWDDMDGLYGRELVYSWFGLSESAITGVNDQNEAHVADIFYAGLLPVCSRDMGSTQDTVGTVFVPVQAVEAPRITQSKAKNGIKVTLKSATPGADIYYTIDGKNPSSSFTRSYHYIGTFLVNSDVTLKAIAVCDGKKDSPVATADVKGRMYTVKFNTLGGSKISSEKVWPGQTVSKPANPTYRNYKFGGWYSDKSCTTKWKFKSGVTKDITLYAKWTKVKVKQTSVRTLKNKSGGKLDIVIRKVTDAKGYQIRYSTQSNMKSFKKVSTKKNKKTISGLKAGNKYYIQVRAYKLDSAKNKIYGKWSSVKMISI